MPRADSSVFAAFFHRRCRVFVCFLYFPLVSRRHFVGGFALATHYGDNDRGADYCGADYPGAHAASREHDAGEQTVVYFSVIMLPF